MPAGVSVSHRAEAWSSIRIPKSQYLSERVLSAWTTGRRAWIGAQNTAIFSLAAEEVAAVYEQFFGLADEPFRLTPDPHYLYLSAKHAEALAHLRLGLTESSGFVCITGEVGTGKTTLLRTFLAELGPDVAAAYPLTPPRPAPHGARSAARHLPRVRARGDR